MDADHALLERLTKVLEDDRPLLAQPPVQELPMFIGRPLRRSLARRGRRCMKRHPAVTALTIMLIGAIYFVKRDPARAIGLAVNLVTILDWILGSLS